MMIEFLFDLLAAVPNTFYVLLHLCEFWGQYQWLSVDPFVDPNTFYVPLHR